MISTLPGRQIRDLDYLARVSEGKPCNLRGDLAYISWVGPAFQSYSIHISCTPCHNDRLKGDINRLDRDPSDVCNCTLLDSGTKRLRVGQGYLFRSVLPL